MSGAPLHGAMACFVLFSNREICHYRMWTLGISYTQIHGVARSLALSRSEKERNESSILSFNRSAKSSIVSFSSRARIF